MARNDPADIPLTGMSVEEKRQFQLHLNDLRDEYQDQLADLIREAKVTVPNALDADSWDEDALSEVRRLLGGYGKQANRIAADYYAQVRAAWQHVAGSDFPSYENAKVGADRALWQIVGGFNSNQFVGLKFKDLLSGRSHAGLTLDDLWAKAWNGHEDDYDYWAQMAKDVINHVARLTVTQTAKADPSRPRYARVPVGKTCAFCTMLASRGFVYWSDETAGALHAYHKDCDCKIIPTWGSTKLKGYEPDKLRDAWREASKAAGVNASLKAKLRALRGMHPDLVTDGDKQEAHVSLSPELDKLKTAHPLKSLSEAAHRRVNPQWDQWWETELSKAKAKYEKYLRGELKRRPSPRKGNKNPWAINCQRVCQAVELQMRGYDVMPLGNTDQNSDGYEWNIAGAWRDKNGHPRKFSKGINNANTIERMREYPTGSRFFVQCSWKAANSAHIWNAEIVERHGNKEVLMHDAQTGDLRKISDKYGYTASKPQDPASYVDRAREWSLSFLRVDDLVPTDTMLTGKYMNDTGYTFQPLAKPIVAAPSDAEKWTEAKLKKTHYIGHELWECREEYDSWEESKP